MDRCAGLRKERQQILAHIKVVEKTVKGLGEDAFNKQMGELRKQLAAVEELIAKSEAENKAQGAAVLEVCPA